LSSTYAYNHKPQVFFLPATFFDPTANSDDFTSIEASAKNVYLTNLLFTYPLLQFDNKPALANAMINKENAILENKTTENKKIAEVRKAYYEALWTKAQQNFWNENIQRQNQILSESRLRLIQGFFTETDTLQAFVQVENLKPQLQKAKNSYLIAEKQLKLLLDLKNDETFLLTDSLVFIPMVDKQDKSMIENRPDLQQLNLQIQMSENQFKAERAKALPNLQFIAQHSITTQQKDFDFGSYKWENSNFIGLQLSVPIFNGMRSYSRIKQAQIQQIQSDEMYQYSVRQATIEEHTYLTSMQETAAQIQSQQTVILAAQRLYSMVYDRWKQGLLKQGDLQDAELALQQARINHIGLVYQYLVIETELKRVKGL
jgi:outer membrane protein TolC